MRWNIALAGLAASWGFVAVIVAAVALGPEPLAFFRLGIAAGALGIVALTTRRTLRAGSAWRGLVFLGIAQGVHWLLFFEAVKLGSVALAVLTFYTAPVAIALAAPAFLPERLTNVTIAALVVGGIGVGLVALAGNGGGRFSALAVAAGLGSALAYAALVIVSKRLLLEEVPPLTVAFWDCLVGCVTVAPALAFGGRIVPQGLDEWGAVLLLGVVFTAASTLVYVALLRHVSAQTAGILTFLEPVAAVLLAWALLGEELAPAAALGGMLVLAAGAGVVLFDPTDAAGEPAARVGSSPP